MDTASLSVDSVSDITNSPETPALLLRLTLGEVKV
jgi:hypothetical protein